MTRLIVEAVLKEIKGIDTPMWLELFVSVSRADNGASVTGLTSNNFRVCSDSGSVADYSVDGINEAEWEPFDVQLAGCYTLGIKRKLQAEDQDQWFEAHYSLFGLQVRVPDRETGGYHLGQTVVRVESLGT
jgi:hypothetical protein